MDDDRYEGHAAGAIWLAFLAVIALACTLAFSCQPTDAVGAPAPLPRPTKLHPPAGGAGLTGWWKDDFGGWLHLSPSGRCVWVEDNGYWWVGAWRPLGPRLADCSVGCWCLNEFRTDEAVYYLLDMSGSDNDGAYMSRRPEIVEVPPEAPDGVRTVALPVWVWYTPK